MDYSKNCYCLFLSFYHQLILLWQLEESKLMAICDGAALGIGNKLSPSHISMYKHLLCKHRCSYSKEYSVFGHWVYHHVYCTYAYAECSIAAWRRLHHHQPPLAEDYMCVLSLFEEKAPNQRSNSHGGFTLLNFLHYALRARCLFQRYPATSIEI